MTPPARLAVLLSGSGRTLLNLADQIAAGRLEAQIPLVIASRECLGAERARALGIPTEIIPGVIPAPVLEQKLRRSRIAWVVLAGYLKLVDIPASYAGRVVNIHPALLPRHGGPGMYGHHVHRAVLAAGDRESGCTVHLVDEQFDRGTTILQRRCPVLPNDTPETLAERVFEEERLAYPEALRRLLAERGAEVPMAAQTGGSP